MNSSRVSLCLAAGVLLLAASRPAFAGHEQVATLPSACDAALPVSLNPSFSFSLSFAPPAVVGLLPQGLRANYYVAGGTLEAADGTFSGTVQGVGADWWNLRRDGVLEMNLVAPLVQTSDGSVGEIRQTGRADFGVDGFEKALQWLFPNRVQVRAVLEFGAALGSTIQGFNAKRLLAVGFVESSTLSAKLDSVYEFGEQTDSSLCSPDSPVQVQYVSSFKLRAIDMVSFTKTDGDRWLQYTYGPGFTAGPELRGIVFPGATLRAKVHPDGVTALDLRATLRSVSGETILVSSQGHADFGAQDGRLVPIRIQPEVTAEGTKLDALNRNSMLLVGEVNPHCGDLVLHMYRLPVAV